MNFWTALFGGMFLFNALPHLIKGIAGDKHMTPFKRVSSPTLNVFWAFLNIVFAVYIMGLSSDNLWAFLFGGFLLSLTAAKLFAGPNARLPWHKD